MKNLFLAVFLFFLCLSCEMPSRTGELKSQTSEESFQFTIPQVTWLKEHGHWPRANQVSDQKKREIASIIQDELDLSRELESLVLEMDSLYPEAKITYNQTASQEEVPKQRQGTIQSLHQNYGFIQDSLADNLYFHQQDLVEGDLRVLKPGDTVQYRVEKNAKGVLQATQVQSQH